MSKSIFKGSAMLSPVAPTMVSCGDENISNIFTVAWTGIMCTHPPVTYISVRPTRYSYELIEKTGEFVINLVSSDLVSVCDTVGVKSGREMDKFSAFNLTKENGNVVKAPLIGECPVNIECKVRQKIKLGSHDVFIADIVAVHIDDSVIDKKGKIKLWKADLIAYSHGSYYSIGKHLGDFGFSVRKRKKHNNR